MKAVRTISGGNETAERGHYMISAALDTMESTFSDREAHEKTTGRKNTLYVTPEQMDLIFYLLYEAEAATRQARNRLDGVDRCA